MNLGVIRFETVTHPKAALCSDCNLGFSSTKGAAVSHLAHLLASGFFSRSLAIKESIFLAHDPADVSPQAEWSLRLSVATGLTSAFS
jgi:hypothetical protein